MRAIVITEAGGPEVLRLVDRPRPEPGPGQILVRVAATAINRADLLQRRGGYPSPPGWPADIPGLEYAGTVEAAGPGAARFSTGDRVMGLVGGGSSADYVAVNQTEVMRVPDSLSLEQAAAVPEAFITAYDAMVVQAGLRSGETMLVHAAGSGVGTATLQIAHHIGARTIGTSRTASKLDRARDYGLDVAIETREPTTPDRQGSADAAAFAETVLGHTVGHGADVIIDLVGGDYLAGNLQCLARLGRLIIVGLVAGSKATLDMRALMSRRAMIRGTVLRARSPAEKAEATRAFADFGLPLFDTGVLRPVIDSVMPIEDAAAAHRRMEASDTFGKIVLTL